MGKIKCDWCGKKKKSTKGKMTYYGFFCSHSCDFQAQQAGLPENYHNPNEEPSSFRTIAVMIYYLFCIGFVVWMVWYVYVLADLKGFFN